MGNDTSLVDPAIQKFEQDITDIIKQGLVETSDVVKTGEYIAQDTFRGVTKTVDNVGANFFHSGRYIAKNAVGLIDNTQDHVYQVVQDVRVDISNTVQIFAIITATGLATFFIMYGDKVLKRGLNIGEFSIF